MKKISKVVYAVFLSFVSFGYIFMSCTVSQKSQLDSDFVTVRGNEFYIGDSVYRYIGTNFWYAPILASEGKGGDRNRLKAELDFLSSIGVNNLRILVGGEGREDLVSHISPVLQTAPGVYNDTLLIGLDYLIAELEKRDMKAVLYLNNAWEWSGGFSTYLEWAGFGEAVNPADAGYQAYMEYASNFVRNDSAIKLFDNHIRKIVPRINTITGNSYTDSPAIMSWQIANEPRAFSDESLPYFEKWVAHVASLIKSLDHNHLVSVGSEGLKGCQESIEVWSRLHSLKEIDYGTIHIWPYNWGWIDQDSTDMNISDAIAKSDDYIGLHIESLNGTKPLVVEEFGFPRDGMSLNPLSDVTERNAYYQYIFSLVMEANRINGVNFWGWGGFANPINKIWKSGDDFTGDPAQEPQGLNSVFSTDSSTIELILTNTKR